MLSTEVKLEKAAYSSEQMDENIDLYLSSSPWSDMNPEERSSWECGENETKGQMANSFGVFGMDENDLYTERTSSLTVNCLPTQDALGGSIDYLISSDIFSGETELRKGVDSFNDNCPNIPQNSWLKDESMAKYDMNLPRIGSYSYNASQGLRLDAPEELLETCNGTSLSFAKIGRDGCNDIENFNTPFEEILPPICGAYSPSNAVERNRMQAFGAGRGDFDNDVGSRSVEMNKPLPPDNFSALITTKEGQISQSKGFPSLATESLKAEKASGLPQPVLETIYTPTTGCNVSGKPRLRARRGQATDPHSIAERLRREKISERMKSLQELVPSSSKTDKASMLDEIIEYVRFLQLQVKVLSMSRLGAAEAVVPLVKHNHAEFQGSKSGLILSSSSFEELEYSPSPDQIAFEREIVKLMETNVSEAVQCLQRKGLCLMPIALASAISKTKAQVTDDKSGCLVQNSSSSSSNSNNSSFS